MSQRTAAARQSLILLREQLNKYSVMLWQMAVVFSCQQWPPFTSQN